MALPQGVVHKQITLACLEGDIDALLKLFYYNAETIDCLIKNENVILSDSQIIQGIKPGEYVNAACLNKQTELLHPLYKYNADFKLKSIHGTPLDIVCKTGDVESIKVLVNYNVELDDGNSDDFESHCIFICCLYGHENLLEYLISEIPDYLSRLLSGIPLGSHLLCVACRHGHTGIARILIEKGVDMNALVPLSTTGIICSPLYLALEGQHLDCYNYLLNHCPEIQTDVVDFFYEHLKPYATRFIRPALSLSNNLLSGASQLNRLSSSGEGFSLSEKKLYAIHVSWFLGVSTHLRTINLHHNRLSFLPNSFFAELPYLEELDVSDNLLRELPFEGLLTAKIGYLQASCNRLSSLPGELFHNPHIIKIDASKNSLTSFHGPFNLWGDDHDSANEQSSSNESPWQCAQLNVLSLDYNEIEAVPIGIHGATSLVKLQLGHNGIKDFVPAWSCPLEDLDLGFNGLSSFDIEMELYWSKTLSKLVLSHNNLPTISSHICKLEALTVLDIASNHITVLPKQDEWKCNNLGRLNLANNLLSASCGPDGFTDLVKKSLETAMVMNVEPQLLSNCEFPVSVFKEALQILNLSGNQLEKVPESICSLENLCELDLSNNPGIKVLPASLGNLRNLWSLGLDNLELSDIPPDITGKSRIRSLLAYLKAKLRKSVRFNRMKLMMAGLQERGKTSLLANLQGKRLPPDLSTVGIAVGDWTLSPNEVYGSGKFWFWKGDISGQKQDIIFSTWDLAGQQVYYTTHQCFLTSNTLYLVVWNASHGQKGLMTLEPWLLNIQARAPKSRVITVGTFIDRIPVSSRPSILENLEYNLMSKFDRKGFPVISGNVFVSNKTGEGLPKLREIIYKVASKMHDSNLEEPMVGKKVPLSYVQLYDAVVTECQLRRQENITPILTADELLEIAKTNPDNDILDADELNYAAQFLHDTGVIAHFNDQLRGLNHLYFIDPTWLCDMMALIITVRERNPFTVDGYIKFSDLKLVLKNPRLPSHFIPQYLQLLERFEIVLTLDVDRILVPSMLPPDKPVALIEQVNKLNCSIAQSDSEKCLCRNYIMSYVPTGFWNRLVARIIIAVHKWGMVTTTNDEDTSLEEVDQRQTYKGMTTTDSYAMVYWRQGIFVQYNSGKFLVESFADHDKGGAGLKQGVAISVWSIQEDFSVMGFAVDQVDMLIMEWYPGLEDVNEYGDPLIDKRIPCPVCIERASKSVNCISFTSIHGVFQSRDDTKVNQFDLRVCALAAVGHKYISCDRHEDGQPVDLLVLIPDLLLTDLPEKLILNPNEFEFEPSHKTQLGEGGAGGVYCGKINNRMVAVKQFHSTQSSRFKVMLSDENESKATNKSDVYHPNENVILEQQVEDGKVIQSFLDMRQEVSMLCRLSHPCIISFLGVSRMPLCFAIELAPLGCLQTVLEERANKQRLQNSKDDGQNYCDPVLGRKLTYKIALQVAHALMYLHDSDIVYRDLKSDNILLWSLSEEDIINVKLSDYGISCFAMPQGVVGEGGTPGFQAPEVRFGLAYDEKVDIFSYGIWLYELMTGQRPLKEHRTSAELKKAIHRGCRPSLEKAEINPTMPLLEELMKDCWQRDPLSRPSSQSVVAQLEHLQLYITTSCLPQNNQSQLNNVTCILPLDQSSSAGNQLSSLMQHRILICCGSRADRRFIVIAAESGIVQLELEIPGQRVLCASKIDDFVWLGTEGCQIEIFGRKNHSTPSILACLPTKDAVTHILPEKNPAIGSPTRIFCALANGTIVVFVKDVSRSNKNKASWSMWGNPCIINLTTKGLPAKHMVITNNNTELWVASGNYIVIIDLKSLAVEQLLKVFSSRRSLIVALTTNQTHVWSIDRKSSVIYQWDVKTRCRVLSFDMNVANPVGLLLSETYVEKASSLEIKKDPEITSPERKVSQDQVFIDDQRTKEEGRDSADDANNSVKNVTDKIAPPPQLSLTPNESKINLLSLAPLILKLRRKQPSLMLHRKFGKTRQQRNDLITTRKNLTTASKDSEIVAQSRPRTAALSFARYRPTSIIINKDVLWVGRASGDLLAIDLTAPSSTDLNMPHSIRFGEVLAQLTTTAFDESEHSREITDSILLPSNRIVVVRRVSLRKGSHRRLSSRLSDTDQFEDMKDDVCYEIMTFMAFNQSQFSQHKSDIQQLQKLADISYST